MILYRLIRSKYVESAWSGTGAKLYGGRWHNIGRPAVYVTTSVSLAVLEVLVHVGDDELLTDFALLSIDIPENQIDILNIDTLPPDWNDPIPPVSTMEIGSEWLDVNDSIGLMVPSAIIPYENNVMLNPMAKDFQKYMSTIKRLDFGIDSRLAKTKNS
ncbi:MULTISPECIES: RES family NAD+ phosphorylase [Photorhabdus]|uniref:RES domain-containing protein n=2 Tax=Photorhabdus TaxID=29487 RepID=A0ABX0B2A5_9GAMM|nr:MULTISPECIES: RES family NAD+ phosphorylase [Photorhabdus]MCC8376148.1 RES family NAD+ phosphorylase [Photorhabdus bodei]MCC8466298.1 RES family NAD+ phosphorylase [Photorhabdus bodei]MCT8354116.1 RES family NAD+ phosphorylase [Photorhabdus kayaii]MDB6367643.1 RES family NAD+ phosphorylase [Photorhabdus bodei]MDB6371233.1 RES family NAD+ phosphorylase [Photorhabdus bodei]